MPSIFCKNCKKDFSDHKDYELIVCAFEISKGET